MRGGEGADGPRDGVHLLTGEYPPQRGGVSDYTAMVAGALAARGHEVHVWCPAAEGHTPGVSGVTVHRVAGGFAPGDLRRLDAGLGACPSPRRLVVQWVPQAFGGRGMNVGVCLWLWKRARVDGDRVEVMFHEALVAFAGSWKQRVASVAHRAMAALLLRAAARAWVSNPYLEGVLRGYLPAGRPAIEWLPVPSNVPVADAGEAVARVRSGYLPRGGLLLGHFGTFGRHVGELLREIVPGVLAREPAAVFLLIGRGGESERDDLLAAHPELAGRVHATGGLPGETLSHHLSACDLMVQPYPEGVSTRRGSMMACMAHGLPTLTTRGPVTEEIWEGAVELTPATPPGAVVERVGGLLRDPARRARLAAAARELYARRFALDHTVAELERADPRRRRAADG